VPLTVVSGRRVDMYTCELELGRPAQRLVAYSIIPVGSESASKSPAQLRVSETSRLRFRFRPHSWTLRPRLRQTGSGARSRVPCGAERHCKRRTCGSAGKLDGHVSACIDSHLPDDVGCGLRIERGLILRCGTAGNRSECRGNEPDMAGSGGTRHSSHSYCVGSFGDQAADGAKVAILALAL